MKKLFQIVICLLFFFGVKGQQLPIFSLYAENSFVLNPAMTGVEDHGVIVASYRDQWSEMEGRPRTVTGSYRTPIYRTNMGIGGMVLNDMTGPSSLTGISVDFAYHISFRKISPFHWAKFLRKSKVSIGISASAYQYRLKGSDLIVEDPNDQAISGSKDSRFLPNVGAGIYYYYDKFYLGFSAPQIIPLSAEFDGDNGKTTVKRVNHFYLVSGGKIPLGGKVPRGHYNKFYIEPMIWFKYVKGAPYQIDGYIRGRYKNRFWFGAGYRSSKTLIVDAGFLIRNQFQVGYAYDMPVSSLRKNLGNTHEVMVAFHFQSKKNRSFGVR